MEDDIYEVKCKASTANLTETHPVVNKTNGGIIRETNVDQFSVLHGSSTYFAFITSFFSNVTEIVKLVSMSEPINVMGHRPLESKQITVTAN